MRYRFLWTRIVALCAIASPALGQPYQVQAVAAAASPDCFEREATGLLAEPSLHASASCTTTGTALASATADLPTATVALQLFATAPPPSDPGGSNAGGQAQFVDDFIFDVPDGLLGPNENLLVDVTLTLDAMVVPGTIGGSANFVDYGLSMGDLYYFFSPGSSLSANGTINGSISGATDYVGTVAVHPPFFEAQLSMTVASFSGIREGDVDVVGSIAIDVPQGVTWTSLSGVLLTVPEPGALSGALGCLLALTLLRSRTRAADWTNRLDS